MSRRVPRLYRVSGILGGIGTLIVVVLMLYLSVAIYSASQLRGSGSEHQGSSTVSVLGNGTALVLSTVNLTNPGYFAIDDLSVSLQIRDPGGALLAVGGVRSVTIPAQGNGTIPVSVWIPLGGTAASLVTHDAQLIDHIWLNASYASLFTLHIATQSNFSWGAPLFGLTATSGTPIPQSNGSVLVPVTLMFQNHAGFGDQGTVTVAIRDSTGGACGSGTLPVNAGAGTNFAQTLNVLLAPGCNPSGGVAVATYTGNGLTVALPPVAIP